jgi:hypothetical protein
MPQPGNVVSLQLLEEFGSLIHWVINRYLVLKVVCSIFLVPNMIRSIQRKLVEVALSKENDESEA